MVVDGLHVAAADVRDRELRPHGFGVDVLQGAFTLWNRQDEGEGEADAHRVADAVAREATGAGCGAQRIWVQFCLAVLELGLGNYQAALQYALGVAAGDRTRCFCPDATIAHLPGAGTPLVRP